MPIWNWLRRRTLRRWRRTANKRYVSEAKRLDHLLDNARTLLKIEKAKVKVLEAEKDELYKILARNRTRVEAETAVSAKQIADLTGVLQPRQ